MKMRMGMMMMMMMIVVMMMMIFFSTSAFPCWDEPAVKATFSVTIIIPAHLTAISNMPELSVIHLPSTTTSSSTTAVKDPSAKVIPLKKVVFDTSPKMSTYLLAWAIGEFDFVQGTTKSGVSIRVITPPGRGMQGKFALDVGIRSLEFYDDFFKVCVRECVCM
jgi:aminopeptidase N